MPEEQYLHLQHSESVVANMAATIFSAFISNNALNANNEDELIEKSVALATKLATLTEKVIKSDEEWVGRERKTDPQRYA